MAGYIGKGQPLVSNGAERKFKYVATAGQTVFNATYSVGSVHVYRTGVRLTDGVDYTATNGSTVTLTTGCNAGDDVVIVSTSGFQVADAYTKAETDLAVAGVTLSSLGIDNHNNIVVDSSGRVTMPYQPSFLAIDAAYRTSSGEINAGVVQHNIGGHYNPSTGRFTAPVSGSYVFSFSTLLYTMGSPSKVTLHINGSNTIGLSSYGVYGSFTGTYAGQGASHTIYLNVGDYASFYLANSGTNLHGNYTAISGHLIG